MGGDQYYSLSLATFVALCIVILGVSGLPWKIDPHSGGLGTSDDIRMAFASYEMDAGDTICYEYEASEPCRFIITTDPYNLDIGEVLNLSGTRNAGSFECQTDGSYYLQVDFLEMPTEGVATIHYECHAIDDSSALLLMAKPVVLTISTILLISLVFGTFKRGRQVNSHGGIGKSMSYWECFGGRTSNWIVILAGSVTLIAASVMDYFDPTTDVSELSSEWAPQVGQMAIAFGLLFGLIVAWGDRRTRTP